MQSNFPRIEALDSLPVVGAFYDVPCLVCDRTGSWVPILGDLHSDPEIGISIMHWHPDARFLSKLQIRLLFRLEDVASVLPLVVNRDDIPDSTVQRRVLKCFRQMPEFPVTPRTKPFTQGLEKIFSDRKLECLSCPHRHFNLADVPVVEDQVTCPGHGLRWNVKTGALVKRC
ncbi:Rieske 2Fe-2S domain-containing protein [Trichocoleus sp. FACHB-591]|uniref:Rieske (2Fe-2S) protein n=1 Tax=Trichocoleus sp. FACHB-591 TaxID=2692872 RepID=UPI0016884AD5|nr:Rieske 2Fe-2S domain-containing protein [Trichocoleus sp. FACHB-591]MBD2099232.1 Rieske 2Fe-2S domain-containing protein [Trichocoleus sp. FACHB-591]